MLSLGVLGGLLASGASAFQAVRPSRTPARAFSRTPKLAAVVNIEETAPRDVGAMDEWATACGVQRAGGIQLTSEDGSDFSVMTTQDLPDNSPVLYVPSEMILSSSGIRQELEGYIEDAEDLLGRLGAFNQLPQFHLFLKVLMEYERGDDSPFFPWLNSLPRWFSNGAAMTPFCYECLPPLVSRLAMDERVRFINFWNALKKVEFLSDETKGNQDIARWAFNVVQTRSFSRDGVARIVPMADMFNHGTETEIRTSYDDNGNCNVFTTKDVPAGSPLRMSYGDPTNPSQLLATYGFLDETSPATFCKIMDIKPTVELENLGLDYSRMVFYKDTGEISEEVWDVLLYAKVLASNKEHKQAFYEAHISGDVETKQSYHQFYFPQTATTLKKHVDTFLEELDTLLAKSDGKDVYEHPRLPLILSHNEFVKHTFLRVKAQLDPMVAQATGEPAQTY